ncbi:MAG: hypothetical protein R3F56_00445 [Planctomycetota bacterium]
MRDKLHLRTGVLVGATLLSACTRTDLGEARAVVERFCIAVAAGDVAGARACLVATDRANQAGRLDQRGLRDGYEVGAAQADGECARVEVRTKSTPAPVTFVLVREDSAWRIDLRRSTEATLGSKLEQVRKVLDQAGKQMVDRLEQSRRGAQTPPAPR